MRCTPLVTDLRQRSSNIRHCITPKCYTTSNTHHVISSVESSKYVDTQVAITDAIPNTVEVCSERAPRTQESPYSF